jgi:Na+-transporting NADH:ubiquinone oxidoreductase subunit C
MAKKKQILYPVVFMVIITAFFTFLLAFINDVTKDTIEQQQELVIQRSILSVFDFDILDKSDDDIVSMFTENIDVQEVKERTVFIYEGYGYAFEFSGKGLWGTITGHIAIDRTHKEILGVNFVAHSETPGLGGRIDEEDFKQQFKNLVMNEPILTLNKSTGGNLDAISGATLTSLAVRDIVNAEIPTLLEFAKKEGFYEGN